jgi:hypothetical protein
MDIGQRQWATRVAILTCSIILALLGPMAAASTAGDPPHLSLVTAAMNLTPTNVDVPGRDGHGVTASFLAGRSSNVADFVRTWEDRFRNGVAFDTTGPDPSAAAASTSCLKLLGLLTFRVPVQP